MSAGSCFLSKLNWVISFSSWRIDLDKLDAGKASLPITSQARPYTSRKRRRVYLLLLLKACTSFRCLISTLLFFPLCQTFFPSRQTRGKEEIKLDSIPRPVVSLLFALRWNATWTTTHASLRHNFCRKKPSTHSRTQSTSKCAINRMSTFSTTV